MTEPSVDSITDWWSQGQFRAKTFAWHHHGEATSSSMTPRCLAEAYRSSRSIAELAELIGVSAATVRRAMIRHGIDRLARATGIGDLPAAAVLDDRDWLADRYRVRTGVEIADDLGVSTTAVYAAMKRHGIDRRSTSSTLPLRKPELSDADWLARVVEHDSSVNVAGKLGVSPGTVTTAYRRAGIDPSSTTRLFARGRRHPRPPARELLAAWHAEETYRGVARRFAIAPNTAAVWLAEVGVFVSDEPVLSRRALTAAVNRGLTLSAIAHEHHVSVMTVLVDLHRHQLFDAHRTRHRLGSEQR